MSFSSSKLFADDDEDDFQAVGRKTNLGNIFGGPAGAQTDSSLTFQRPKAPTTSATVKATSEPTAKSHLPNLIHSLRVDLYKPDTSPAEYTAVGAAIVDNPGGTKFRIILYLTKDKLIAKAPITKDFALTIQNQEGVNYGSFRDDTNKSWSFRFENQEDADKLAIYLAIARFYEDPSQTVIQDVFVPPKGNPAAKEDILGVRYLGYSQKSGKLSGPIDDKAPFVKYVIGGPNKAGFPGWEVGLTGIRRSGVRVLLVPEDGDSAKIYRLTAEKMKKGGSSSTAAESAPSSGKLPKEEVFHHAEEGSNTSTSPGSNTILQRMAKLTVATPFAGALKSHPDDSSHSESASQEQQNHNHNQQNNVRLGVVLEHD